MIEDSMEQLLEGEIMEPLNEKRLTGKEDSLGEGQDQLGEISFSIEVSDVSGTSLGECEIFRRRRGSRQRNPFRNMTNCSNQAPSPHKDLFYSFAKKTTNSPLKPALKENRVSQETKVSEGESLFESIIFQEEKSGNVQLAEQLQERIKLLDEKIAAKLGEIKSQFWRKRANSLTCKPTFSTAPQQKPKQSLLSHLQRKHSECDPPEALKACYMKFIPMRGVLSYQQRPVTNKKVAQSRLSERVSLQFKFKV